MVTASFSSGFLISLKEMLPRSFPRHSSMILLTVNYRSTRLLLHTIVWRMASLCEYHAPTYRATASHTIWFCSRTHAGP